MCLLTRKCDGGATVARLTAAQGKRELLLARIGPHGTLFGSEVARHAQMATVLPTLVADAKREAAAAARWNARMASVARGVRDSKSPGKKKADASARRAKVRG